MTEMYELIITDLAKKEMKQSTDYIAFNLKNPIAAKNLANKVKKKIQEIPYFPHSYPDCQIYEVADVNFRHIIFGNYVLIFHITEESHTIEIVRFLYGKTNISKIQIVE